MGFAAGGSVAGASVAGAAVAGAAVAGAAVAGAAVAGATVVAAGAPQELSSIAKTSATLRTTSTCFLYIFFSFYEIGKMGQRPLAFFRQVKFFMLLLFPSPFSETGI